MVLVVVAVDDVLRVSLHRESLARAGGPVDKDGTVLAIDESIAQRGAIDVCEHFLLRGICVEHFFERVNLLVLILHCWAN